MSPRCAGATLAAALLFTAAQASAAMVEVPVLVNEPTGKGPHPLLIIAPAKKYLMKERLFERLALAARNNGFLVVRFNWLFAKSGGEPSPGFADEAEQLGAVISRYAGRSDVRKDAVFLAAKSMGSKIAMKAELSSLRGLLLLTPNCDGKDGFGEAYAPAFAAKKPVHVAISKDDPYCAVQQIYAFAKDHPQAMTLQVLEGDHNFAAGGGAQYSNQDAAIAGAVSWLKTH